MRSRHVIPALVLTVAFPLAGCTSAASYDERMEYLRKMAEQGAETHQLLVDQGAPEIDKARCIRAFDALINKNEFPGDQPDGGTSEQLSDQIREIFVDSCVSGRPGPGSGAPKTTTTTTGPEETTTTTTPAPTTTTTTPGPTTTTTTTTTTTS